MSGLLTFALWAAFAAVGVSILLASIRLAIGPSLPDRILALDTLYVNAVATAILLGIGFDTFAYMEAALLIALMGFIATVSLARYAARGRVSD
jgi:multicomponent K+:H+ antiporter subunit F